MNVKVEDVMSENLVVGYVPGNIKDALSILAKHNVSGMPILKKETKQVVAWVDEAIKNKDNKEFIPKLKAQVEQFCKKFPVYKNI